ncbi:MAG: serine hydrolase [Sporocytophaga sp.]|uniref:serine hydrolase domain-containing protein n=1 Tax=Sporocytophaga sp. TaxID=2231183 RepID=UPI001B0547B4|nr:serine hydrolase [Sporocytophaga sp.]MBO9703565.1 serine hydrolase [Sporocytophaga sp.]
MKQLFIIFLSVITISCQSQNKLALEELETIPGLYSTVVLQNDTVAFRKFYNGKDDETYFHIHSETKSIMALLIGIAIDKGFIKSVDQTISDFYPVILDDTSKLKKQITIRHLLNQTSGLAAIEWPNSMCDQWLNSPNPSLFLLSLPMDAVPGSKFSYSTPASHLLSGIITKATGMETADFADKYLLNPLGITDHKWVKLHDGFYDGGGTAVQFKTDDMLKIARLILNNGTHNGKVLISQKYVGQVFQKDKKILAPWGLKNSYYNFCWYTADFEGYEVRYAIGYGGQFIFIIPALNTVIAVNHNTRVVDPNKQSGVFLEKSFPVIFKQVLAASEGRGK